MPLRRWSSILAVAAVVACGGDGGGPSIQAGSLAVSAGNDQVGAAGAALPESLAVLVRDDAGEPLPGVTVTWQAAIGGGNVSPTTRVSDAAGIAKARRTLGPSAGTQTTTAAAPGASTITFDAVAQIQGAVNMANATTGPLTDTIGAVKAESLTVTVTDQTAAPVAGVQVNWASNGGVVSSSQVATNASGQSKVQFTYGTNDGSQTATATVAGLVGSPVAVTLNATAGALVEIDKTGGDGGTAPPSSQVTYTVQALDRGGNPKGGVTIEWAVATGGGSIAAQQDMTAANGNASATRTLGASTGAQTATATATGPSGPLQVTFTTTAAVVTTVAVSNNNFNPSAITVPVGAEVTWQWQGVTVAHNVTFSSANAPADIPNQTSGFASRTFETGGTFNYECTNHPGIMTGSVTVN